MGPETQWGELGRHEVKTSGAAIPDQTNGGIVSVVAATTADHGLSGTSAVDGVNLSSGDKVLVWQQSTASQNGVYLARSGAWVLVSPAPLAVVVTGGSANGLHLLIRTSATAWQKAYAVYNEDWSDCATTANITLSGAQTVDGVSVTTQRVLVKNQSTASQNGLYVAASGAWTKIGQPAFVAVKGGTLNTRVPYVLSAANTYSRAYAAVATSAGT